MWLTVSTNCCQHRGSQAGSPRIVRWSGNRSSESIVTLWDMQRQEEDEEEGRDSTMYSSTRCRFFYFHFCFFCCCCLFRLLDFCMLKDMWWRKAASGLEDMKHTTLIQQEKPSITFLTRVPSYSGGYSLRACECCWQSVGTWGCYGQRIMSGVCRTGTSGWLS